MEKKELADVRALARWMLAGIAGCLTLLAITAVWLYFAIGAIPRLEARVGQIESMKRIPVVALMLLETCPVGYAEDKGPEAVKLIGYLQATKSDHHPGIDAIARMVVMLHTKEKDGRPHYITPDERLALVDLVLESAQ